MNSYRLASFLALLAGVNLPFLIGALAWFIKITKAAPFESVEVFRKDPFLALYFSLFSSMIFLPSISCSLYADDLVIWASSPRFPLRWRPHKELCFDWSTGLSTGVFLLIRANVRPPSFQWIPTKLTSSYSAPASVSNPTSTFVGVIFDRTLSFSKHASSLRTKFFPRLKALHCISASPWGPSKKFFSLLYKTFLRLLLTYAPPGWFPFLSVAIVTNWNAFTERPVAPSPAASRPSLSLYYSPRVLCLPYEPP